MGSFERNLLLILTVAAGTAVPAAGQTPSSTVPGGAGGRCPNVIGKGTTSDEPHEIVVYHCTLLVPRAKGRVRSYFIPNDADIAVGCGTGSGNRRLHNGDRSAGGRVSAGDG